MKDISLNLKFVGPMGLPGEDGDKVREIKINVYIHNRN